MIRHHKLFIDGKWLESEDKRDVHELRSPFDHEPVARVDYASNAQMQRAITASVAAFTRLRKVSRHGRARLLEGMRDGIARRRHDFARLIAVEAGKPITLAEVEVSRALNTFTVAAEEVKRFGGDVIPIDIEATGRAYSPAVAYWVPRGPVLGITPFNFPLNLVAHKVAPALAAGCSILVKPAPQAPGAAALLAEIFEEAAVAASDAREEIPAAAFQVVSCPNHVAELAVTDPRIPTLTFTGSGKVGWWLQTKAVGKKIALELGGNAGVIVHSDADLARAALRCAAGGNGYAGQTCISVQRIFVQNAVVERFTQLLVAETAKLVSGDPLLKETTVGPLIDTAAADRVMAWIAEAHDQGARVLCGGTRLRNVVQPTVLTGVKRTARVSCEEAFGPVVIVEPYESFADAIEGINDSKYGLQSGVFTDSQARIREAVEGLEVGGVMINEVPTYRADQMPYGGVKESGLGREGLRYAMEEYSERKVVVQWHG